MWRGVAQGNVIPGPPVDGKGCILSNVQLYVNVIIVRTWIEMIVSTSPCLWVGGCFLVFCMLFCSYRYCNYVCRYRWV